MSPASARSSARHRFCFFFHEAPLLIKLQGAWGHVSHALVMQPLGVAAGHPEKACDRVFGDCAQACRGPHPAPFVHMINDSLGVFLRDLRIK